MAGRSWNRCATFGPEIDTVTLMPTSELSTVHMDPEFPLPYTGDGLLLTDFPAAAIDEAVNGFVGSPLLHFEVRHLGGAAEVASPENGVLDAIDQPFVTFTFGIAPNAPAFEAVDRRTRVLLDALGPWDSGRRYLNFAESVTDPRSIFPAESYDRLLRAKQAYDPTNMFSANHSVSRPQD